MPVPVNTRGSTVLGQNCLLNVQGFRFGNNAEALLKAIDIGFEKSVKPRNEVYKGCLKTLEMVCAALCSLAQACTACRGEPAWLLDVFAVLCPNA